MKISVFADNPFGANCYFLQESDLATVIDPTVPPEVVRAVLGTLPKVGAILLTHGHEDHLLALDAWRKETGAPVCIHRMDGPYLTQPALNCSRWLVGEERVHPAADVLLEDGDTTPGAVPMRVLSTPGHTPGSCCFLAPEALFTGDTLFDGGYGRTDLPGGQGDALRQSLRGLYQLDSALRFYPGHGSGATLREETWLLSQM